MEPDPTDLAELNVRQRLSLAQIDARYGHTTTGRGWSPLGCREEPLVAGSASAHRHVTPGLATTSCGRCSTTACGVSEIA